MNRTLTFAMIPALAVILGGGIQIARPLPAPQLVTTQAPIKLPGTFSVNLPKQGQMAVGEESLGVVSATPNQEPVAIASLTKMMTAYLLLQAKPLKVGEDGPITTITAADVQEYDKDRAAGDSVAKVSAGEKLSERQLLEALMLPSADNIATLIANQVAGSEENFVKKMNEAAKALGMSQTTYADAAGVSPSTVSTASDQLRIAQAAMQDRTFREVVGMPQADLPTAGVVYNVNFMVGKQGISGVKTGSTLAAGSCFVGSYPVTIGGTPRIVLAAVLGQVSLKEALAYDVATLHAAAPQFKTFTLAAPADGFAQLTTSWHQDSKLELAKPLQVFGYPGMPVTLAGKLTQTSVPVTAGQAVGTLTVTAGSSTQEIGLTATQAVQGPGLMGRIFR